MHTGVHLETGMLILQPTQLRGKLISEFTPQFFENKKS